MRTKARVPVLVVVLAGALASASAADRVQAAGVAAQRMRPPAFVTCDRNQLTVFSGKVVALSKGRNETRLEMNTDEQTTEQFTITHPGSDASSAFFAAGRPFTEADWAAFLPGGRLREGARASVWVCSNEANPKVDWAPAAASRP